MYSIRFFFFFLCLNFISGFELPHFGKGPYENTLKRTMAKTPLTFFLPTLTTRLLNYTGKSMETIPNPKTIQIMTGGVVGNIKYRLLKGRFFWEHGTNGTSLIIRFYFYNLKYESFQKAIKHPDGILVFFFPVETNSCTDNPAFGTFEGIFEKHIKTPGSSALINSFLSYKWYDHYSYDSVYTSYKGTFYDEEMGVKFTDVLIFQLPKHAAKNYISDKQFADTFGSLVDCSGQLAENPHPKIDHDPSSVLESKAICMVLTPE